MDQYSGPETVEAARTDNEARREALKKFGRHAAVAPAVMLLLDPRSGHAYPDSQGNQNQNGQ
jgi:hypothetical protein